VTQNKRNLKRFTPEVLALYRRARAIRDQDPESDAYRDAYMDLHLALGRPPWDADIFEALEHRDAEFTPEMIKVSQGHCVSAQWGLWRDARDLGLELERLDRET
jgi:hypothetical protein